VEAVEFQTIITGSGTITIPEDVSQKLRRGKVRIIVIDDEPKFFDRDETNDRERDRAMDFIRFLMANPIEFSTPFLTRDEIYDRGQ